MATPYLLPPRMSVAIRLSWAVNLPIYNIISVILFVCLGGHTWLERHDVHDCLLPGCVRKRLSVNRSDITLLL